MEDVRLVRYLLHNKPIKQSLQVQMSIQMLSDAAGDVSGWNVRASAIRDANRRSKEKFVDAAWSELHSFCWNCMGRVGLVWGQILKVSAW